ncbi:PRC-barrel domain-containing protein [Roseobacter sp. YSTF-M11]|uniref:PRC-barrel domain-containing protein n=1 Tax=Roseobacter insulae TaxID=2859783 RepID=A0A9X1FV57_9RHOB|nr:PRC-barrel domain-containing protein [Roseobacter insulae]MBW4707453.1 PRC-barrel domain-containing protein [Roseobacter insulae]
MKKLMASTATALVLSTAAFADAHSSAFFELTFDKAMHVSASDILGARVYVTETDLSATTTVEADGEKQWDDIGEINDIVLNREGSVESVIVGVGGFVGIGEKDVAIDMSELKFISDGEDADEYFLVVNASVANFEAAPAYEAPETSATETSAMGYDKREMLTAPSVERDGYSTVKADDLTTEDLTGARVYGPGDEDVGEIDQLLLTDAGKLDRAVIDVGGFLGLGERPVAVTFDELQIVRSEDGNVRVYIDASQKSLEGQPEYEG